MQTSANFTKGVIVEKACIFPFPIPSTYKEQGVKWQSKRRAIDSLMRLQFAPVSNKQLICLSFIDIGVKFSHKLLESFVN